MTDLRKLARGKPCLVRLPGCSGNCETVVLAHYRMSGICGMGMKPPDIFAAWCCDHCHSIADGRQRPPPNYTRNDVRLALAEGVIRTLYELDKMGEL